MADDEEGVISAPPSSDPLPQSRPAPITTNVYLTKPARRQVAKGSGPVRQEFQDHSSDYNVWYHKKLGDRYQQEDRVKSATRCCIARDAGFTRADKAGKDTYICLFFARGHCHHGAECTYHHRPPTIEDEMKLDITHDVFGRERHRNYRDDMGGVGSFSRDNKTLYVSGLRRIPNLEDTITAHFMEWGELSYVKVVYDKAIAFVRYKLRCAAEFAKESMQDQALEGDEVLGMRWSNEDPNPEAKARDDAELYERIAQKIAEKRARDEPVYQYKQQQGGQPGAAATQQETEQVIDNFPLQHDPTQYPDTDGQFQQQNITEIWLKGIGLEKYVNSFIAAGFNELASLSQLDEYGLDACGVINLDDRVTLLEQAQVLQQTYFPSYQDYNAAYQLGNGAPQYIYTNAEYNDPNAQ